MAIPFLVPAGTISTRYKIVIEADGHAPFMTEIPGGPNLRTIHVQTDKQFYHAGETGNLLFNSFFKMRSMYTLACAILLLSKEEFLSAILKARIELIIYA